MCSRSLLTRFLFVHATESLLFFLFRFLFQQQSLYVYRIRLKEKRKIENELNRLYIWFVCLKKTLAARKILPTMAVARKNLPCNIDQKHSQPIMLNVKRRLRRRQRKTENRREKKGWRESQRESNRERQWEEHRWMIKFSNFSRWRTVWIGKWANKFVYIGKQMENHWENS